MKFERNSLKLIARLKKSGWVETGVRGSHHSFKHPAIKGKVTVPHPKHDLPLGTVRSIYRQAGWEEK